MLVALFTLARQHTLVCIAISIFSSSHRLSVLFPISNQTQPHNCSILTIYGFGLPGPNLSAIGIKSFPSLGVSGNSPRITYANVSTTCSASSHTTLLCAFTSFSVCDILGGCNVMIDFPNADAYPASNAFQQPSQQLEKKVKLSTPKKR